MNYLKVDHLGGMYLDAEDWIFNQNGIKEAFAGVASIIGQNCVLSGIAPIVVGGSTLTYEAGFVAIEGEVLRLPAATVALNGAFTYVEIEESNDAAGFEVFQDGGAPQNTYIIRTAKLVSYDTLQTETSTKKWYPALKRISQLIVEAVQENANTFTQRQSWAVGTDSTIIIGQNAILLAGYLGGNTYNVNTNNATVPIERFTGSMPNGTWLAIKFDGSNAVTLGHGISLVNGFDTGGQSFVFQPGEVAIFIWMDAKAKLINGRSRAWIENNPTYTTSLGVTSLNTVSFRWFVDGKTVHCRYFYNIVGTGGDLFVNFTLPFGLVGKSPQTSNALSASFNDGSFPHYGYCRLGNGSDFTKMVHHINDTQIGSTGITGTITFEIE
jgi:hypothetical protein